MRFGAREKTAPALPVILPQPLRLFVVELDRLFISKVSALDVKNVAGGKCVGVDVIRWRGLLPLPTADLTKKKISAVGRLGNVSTLWPERA